MVFGKMTWINWLWNTFFFSATIAKSELRCRNVLMSQTVQWGFPKLGVPQKLDALFHWKSDWIGWFRGTPMLGNLQIIVKYIPTSIIHPSSPQLTTSLLGRAVASRRQSLHLRRGGRALQGGWNPLKFSHNLHSAWWTTIILFSHTKSHHNVTMCGFSFWSDLGVFFWASFLLNPSMKSRGFHHGRPHGEPPWIPANPSGVGACLALLQCFRSERVQKSYGRCP